MKKLDWYIIKKFLGTFFFALALILLIVIVFDIGRVQVRSTGTTNHIVVEVFCYTLFCFTAVTSFLATHSYSFSG